MAGICTSLDSQLRLHHGFSDIARTGEIENEWASDRTLMCLWQKHANWLRVVGANFAKGKTQ